MRRICISLGSIASRHPTACPYSSKIRAAHPPRSRLRPPRLPNQIKSNHTSRAGEGFFRKSGKVEARGDGIERWWAGEASLYFCTDRGTHHTLKMVACSSIYGCWLRTCADVSIVVAPHACEINLDWVEPRGVQADQPSVNCPLPQRLDLRAIVVATRGLNLVRPQRWGARGQARVVVSRYVPYLGSVLVVHARVADEPILGKEGVG